MKFFLSFPWHYDPHGIISEMRVKNKNILYVHVSKPEIEKFANQTVWVPDTLVKVEQQVPPTTVPPTTTPQVPKEKRPRQESSPPVTEVSSEEFHLHTKRPKTTTFPSPTGEKEAPPTTVVKSVIPPFGSSLYQGITPAVPKKSSDSPLDTYPGKIGPKLSIFEKYELIKKKNKTLTSSTYAQFRKQTSTAQHRLMSAFDTEKGRIHMAFLQAQVPDPKVITDYKRATFEFQTKDVHPADQMDLHKQTGEMVFHTLAHASASAAKLQVSLNNAQTQLKSEEMIKKKNADIAALRKQLKLPPTEDSRAKEIAEKEGEKDEMLKLLMEQNAQLKEMEAEMERLLKQKEQLKPMEVIPLTAIPISGTNTATVTAASSTTPSTPQEKTTELAESMERMNL
jgi:hypothetical protein